MRGVYTVQEKISSLSAAKTLMHGTAPADTIVEILETHVENLSNETNEQLEITWQTITTLGTPTDTDITPTAVESNDQAANSTWGANVTASEPTYTANTEEEYKGVPSLTGYHSEPAPESRIQIHGGGSKGLRLLNSPTALDVVVRVKIREIG